MSRHHSPGATTHALLWVLVVLVAAGVLLGGWAFHYYAVRLPWLKRVDALYTQEVQQYIALKNAMDANARGAFFATDRELYDSQVLGLRTTHAYLQLEGAQPRYPTPPPFVPPAGKSP